MKATYRKEKQKKPPIDLKHVVAVALVVLAGAALFAFGLYNSGKIDEKRALGFTQVQISDFKLVNDGSLYVTLKNAAEGPVSIRYINATLTTKNGERISNEYQMEVGNGRLSDRVRIGDFPVALPYGEPYTVEIVIGYVDEKHGLEYAQYGTLTGSAE